MQKRRRALQSLAVLAVGLLMLLASPAARADWGFVPDMGATQAEWTKSGSGLWSFGNRTASMPVTVNYENPVYNSGLCSHANTLGAKSYIIQMNPSTGSPYGMDLDGDGDLDIPSYGHSIFGYYNGVKYEVKIYSYMSSPPPPAPVFKSHLAFYRNGVAVTGQEGYFPWTGYVALEFKCTESNMLYVSAYAKDTKSVTATPDLQLAPIPLGSAAAPGPMGFGVWSYGPDTVIAVVNFWARPLEPERGTIENVGYWWGPEHEVDFAYSYTNPIVVCTPRYKNNILPNPADRKPFVVRIKDVNLAYAQQSGKPGFEVKLQGAYSGTVPPLQSEKVDYIVVEAGAWKMFDSRVYEGKRIIPGLPNYDGNWSGYIKSYGTPNSLINTPYVVLGQVEMTSAEPRWAAFWSCRSGTLPDGPASEWNTSSRYVGWHVGGDSDRNRGNSYLDVIVVGAGSDSLNSAKRYCAGVTPDSFDVRAVMDNPSPPYPYTITTLGSTPQWAVVTQTSMHDETTGLPHNNDGSWAMLYGANPLTSNSISLALDEDASSDRTHAVTENVCYWVWDTVCPAWNVH